MKILVTAGATQTPIDKVRAITNIFKGRTGTNIAQELADVKRPQDHPLAYKDQNGEPSRLLGGLHNVTLLTSNPEIVDRIWDNLLVVPYRTFDDLAQLMGAEIRHGEYDVIIHSAAVSDYRVSQVLTRNILGDLLPLDASKKVSGSHDKLYLELVPTFKIVDKIRTEWGFKGFLVKFKLQVGITDEELLDIARKSRTTSDADLIVANCLEWAKEYAYVVGRDEVAEKVTRAGIATAIAQRAGL